MRSAIKAALSLSVGSTALILSGVAFGQATGITGIDFGVHNLAAPCGATGGPGKAGSCRELAKGDGFIQRQFAVTDPLTGTDQTFIQTVIEDANGFKSEDFVRLGSGTTNQPGIASKLNIEINATDATTGVVDGFKTGSVIKSGWASADPNKTMAIIDLTVARSGTTNKADDFSSGFIVETTYNKAALGTDTDPLNQITNLRVDQTAYLGNPVGADPQKQVFATQIKKASQTATNLKLAGDITGSTGINWSPEQMIQATYVGQAVNVGTETAGALANFSSETFSTLGASPTATFASNLNSANPTYWAATGPIPIPAEFISDTIKAPTFTP